MRILRFRTESGRIHTGVREGEAVRDLGVVDPLLVRAEHLATASTVLRYDELAIEVPLQQV